MDLLERLKEARWYSISTESNVRIVDLYRAMRFTLCGREDCPSITITTRDRSWHCCATGDDYEELCNMSIGDLSGRIKRWLQRGFGIQRILGIESAEALEMIEPLRISV